MQIFRMFLITQNFSCAGIQVIIIITIDHLNNIISSNFIFKLKVLRKLRNSLTDHQKLYCGQIGQTIKL